MKLTRDAFCDLRHKAQQALRRSKETPSVLICAGTGCIAGGALKIYENLKNECESRGLHIKMSGCHGFCEMGPLVHIEPMGIMYIHVKPPPPRPRRPESMISRQICSSVISNRARSKPE